MSINSLEDFEEYEPCCDTCHSYFNDIQELHINEKRFGEGIHLCIDCRKKLINILEESVTTPTFQSAAI